jgi:hypothetical protein
MFLIEDKGSEEEENMYYIVEVFAPFLPEIIYDDLRWLFLQNT